MAAEEGQLVGCSAALVDGNHSKGAAAAGFPVDRDIFGVGLWGMSGRIARSRAGMLTLIRFVSQAFLEMRRLS